MKTINEALNELIIQVCPKCNKAFVTFSPIFSIKNKTKPYENITGELGSAKYYLDGDEWEEIYNVNEDSKTPCGQDTFIDEFVNIEFTCGCY